MNIVKSTKALEDETTKIQTFLGTKAAKVTRSTTNMALNMAKRVDILEERNMVLPVVAAAAAVTVVDTIVKQTLGAT